MGALERFAPPPPAAVSRILATFDRAEIEAFIAVAIDLLDLSEPDPDAEEIDLEDSFVDHHADGPGCPVADSAGDQSAVEWTTLRGAQRRGPNIVAHEDEEDDDPAEDVGDAQDGNFAEDDAVANFAWLGNGPGCPVSDPDRDEMEPDVIFPECGIDQRQTRAPDPAVHRQIMKPHKDRIRREACDPIKGVWGSREWRLRDPKA